ncbi:MAG TPA: mechanosensitive ion channel domain-containing protein [Acidimicrobiales bacterium]|nr:mechanosensitive ion channel domain-containing protein [Acidimicrobiales bacterium]
MIIALVTGAALFTRLATWVGVRMASRIDQRAESGDALVRSERAKHRRAVIQVVTWTVLVISYIVTGVLILQRFNVPLTSLVAPASVAGVAVGFGAQRVVQDLLAGFFIVSERQYGYGDVIRVSSPGTTTGVTGTVEEVTLRVTQMRSGNGELIIIPNGQILQVTNLSRDWARAVIDVPLPVGADLSRATDVLRRLGEEAFGDAALRPLLLDAPSVMGVESMEVDHFTIRIVARTLPGRQFEVSRELRARVAIAMQADGIAVPTLATAGAGGPS